MNEELEHGLNDLVDRINAMLDSELTDIERELRRLWTDART